MDRLCHSILLDFPLPSSALISSCTYYNGMTACLLSSSPVTLTATARVATVAGGSILKMMPSMTSEALKAFGSDETPSYDPPCSSKPQLPVLRWFVQSSSTPKGKSKANTNPSLPPSPSTPTSMLRDALNTDVHESLPWDSGSTAIQRPPQARINPTRPKRPGHHQPSLPQTHHHSIAITHKSSPSQGSSSTILRNNSSLVFHAHPLLSSISRATLPTSSLSLARPPLSHRYSNSISYSSQRVPSHPTIQSAINYNSTAIDSGLDYEVSSPQEDKISKLSVAITSPSPVIEQSPPSRTSIDTLRELYERSLRVLPSGSRSTLTGPRASALTNGDTTSDDIVRTSSNPSPTRWWYRSAHKDSVDDLLDESDQADTIETENAKIRKKCMS